MLAQMPMWLTGLLGVLFILFCVLMILVVLIQRPAGGGLSGAFGSGSGSGQTAFGTKTGDALTIATIAVFAIYLLFAIGLNYAFRPAGPPEGPGPTVSPAGPTVPASRNSGESSVSGSVPVTENREGTFDPVQAPGPSGPSGTGGSGAGRP